MREGGRSCALEMVIMMANGSSEEHIETYWVRVNHKDGNSEYIQEVQHQDTAKKGLMKLNPILLLKFAVPSIFCLL